MIDLFLIPMYNNTAYNDEKREPSIRLKSHHKYILLSYEFLPPDVGLKTFHSVQWRDSEGADTQ